MDQLKEFLMYAPYSYNPRKLNEKYVKHSCVVPDEYRKCLQVIVVTDSFRPMDTIEATHATNFILKHNEVEYLVATQGFKYCRAVSRIVKSEGE